MNGLKTYCNYGIPLIGVWATSWLLNYSDRYIIRIFNSDYEVGIYSTAYNVSQSSVGIMISTITVILFPILIRKWNDKGREEVISYLSLSIDYYTIFMIPAVAGLSMISNKIFGILIDLEYVAGADVVIWSSIGFYFMGLNTILYKLWQLEEKTKKVLVFMTVSVALNIILNLMFVPFCDYRIAAVTTLISYLLTYVLVFLCIQKSFRIKYNVLTVVRTGIATCIMCIFLYICRNMISHWLTLIGLIFVAAVIYLVCFIVLGGFRQEINQSMKKILKKKGN